MTTPFHKGQIVTMTKPKTETQLAAVITTCTPKDLVVAIDRGDGSIVSYSSAKNRVTPGDLASGLNLKDGTSQPISKELQAVADEANGKTVPIKRGQIVSYEMNGEACTGRVEKGGKTVIVTYRHGGQIKGPARDFTPCPAPVIEPDSELADWDVGNMQDEGKGQDFLRWTATVTHKGTPAFKAVCDGDGGPLRYEPLEGRSSDLIDQFLADLKNYGETRGAVFSVCAENWPSYQWSKAPTGISFIDHLNNN